MRSNPPSLRQRLFGGGDDDDLLDHPELYAEQLQKNYNDHVALFRFLFYWLGLALCVLKCGLALASLRLPFVFAHHAVLMQDTHKLSRITSCALELLGAAIFAGLAYGLSKRLRWMIYTCTGVSAVSACVCYFVWTHLRQFIFIHVYLFGFSTFYSLTMLYVYSVLYDDSLGEQLQELRDNAPLKQA